MEKLFFVIAFIWMLTSAGSLLLGPFIGLNRKTLKNELFSYWRKKEKSNIVKSIRRFTLIFSWAGFLFPVVFPIPGFAISILFALFT